MTKWLTAQGQLMNSILKCLLVALLLSPFPLSAAEHFVHPGDSPQEILDRAAPGDRLVFLP